MNIWLSFSVIQRAALLFDAFFAPPYLVWSHSIIQPEEVSWPGRTRSSAIPLSLKLKRITSGLSACATNAFLYALSTALIDALPLFMLPKLRNFLWLGSPEVGSSGLGATGNPAVEHRNVYFWLVVAKSRRSKSRRSKPRRSQASSKSSPVVVKSRRS